MLVCPISVLRHEAGNPYNFNIQFPIYTMGHVTLNLSMYHDTHIHWLDTNIIQFTWHLHDCLFPTQHTLQLDMQLTGEQSCHVSCHVIVRNHFSLSWSRGVAGCCCWSWLQEPGFEPATFRSLVNLLYPQPTPGCTTSDKDKAQCVWIEGLFIIACSFNCSCCFCEVA